VESSDKINKPDILCALAIIIVTTINMDCEEEYVKMEA
jgi:hypothetical protein